jgi:3-hydroxyacyl-[acyl-carrier-protein] dehydratase
MQIKHNDLFNITLSDHEDGAVHAKLEVNRDSDILSGHFPGHPVVPGASMLQAVKEVLETALNTPIKLKKAEHLKFMAMIEPENTPFVDLDITYEPGDNGVIHVSAKLVSGDVVHFKFRGSFIKYQS